MAGDGQDEQAQAERIGARTPRELAFTTGAEPKPIDTPPRRVPLVPDRPRVLGWSRVPGRFQAPGKRGGSRVT